MLLKGNGKQFKDGCTTPSKDFPHSPQNPSMAVLQKASSAAQTLVGKPAAYLQAYVFSAFILDRHKKDIL